MASKKWTLCSRHFGKVAKWCQYADKDRAEAHAKSNNETKGNVSEWFVALYPANPQRIAKVGGRRSCECFRKVGLPQY